MSNGAKKNPGKAFDQLDLLRKRAQEALVAGQPAKAAGLLQKALRLKPSVSHLHLLLSQALALTGSRAEALAHADLAIKLGPPDPAQAAAWKSRLLATGAAFSKMEFQRETGHDSGNPAPPREESGWRRLGYVSGLPREPVHQLPLRGATAGRVEKLRLLCAGKTVLAGGYGLNPLSPNISDLLGVVAGVKPVLICGVRADEKAYLKALADYLGLACSFPAGKGPGQFHFRTEMADAVLGLGGSGVKAAEDLLLGVSGKAGDPETDWGRVLGYPACCVKKFQEWRARQLAKPVWDKERMVRATRENTRGAGAFSFLLNSLFLYQSSPQYEVSDPRERGNLASLLELNKERFGFDLMRLSVIPWHPCSFDCAPSLRKAAKIYQAMSGCLPGMAEELRRVLSRPALFLDRYSFIVFDSASAFKDGAGLRVRFNKVVPPLSLAGPKVLASLNSRKELLVRGDSVLGRDGRTLLKSPSGLPALFLDFSA